MSSVRDSRKRLGELKEWVSYNKSDFRRIDVARQNEFLFDYLNAVTAVVAELVFESGGRGTLLYDARGRRIV